MGGKGAVVASLGALQGHVPGTVRASRISLRLQWLLPLATKRHRIDSLLDMDEILYGLGGFHIVMEVHIDRIISMSRNWWG